MKARTAKDGLSEADARFRAIADSVPAMIWTTDANASSDYLNRRWSEFTGRPMEADIGFGWFELIHPDDQAAVTRTFLSSVADRRPYRAEFRLRRHDGVYRWVLDRGLPRHSPEGEYTGYAGCCTEITDYKELLEQLGEAKEQAEAAARTRSEFLANISHELRTPLNAILGFAEAMTLGIGGTPPQKHGEYLSYIQKSGSLLLGTLNDLIDLSKIDAGQEELQISAVSVHDTLSSCCAIIRPRSDAAGLNLKFAADPGLPRISADERRLKQAILNLLSNAIKFTAIGGRIDVSAQMSAEGDMVIAVKDNGRGIAAVDLPRVMEPFGQVGRADVRNVGGAGLGLPLTKRLIELHDGRLEIESRPGRGTTVCLILPPSRILAPR